MIKFDSSYNVEDLGITVPELTIKVDNVNINNIADGNLGKRVAFTVRKYGSVANAEANTGPLTGGNMPTTVKVQEKKYDENENVVDNTLYSTYFADAVIAAAGGNIVTQCDKYYKEIILDGESTTII